MINWFKNLFRKKSESKPLKLYEDYLFALDYDFDKGKEVIRMCYIQKIHETGSVTVRIPSLNRVTTVKWISSVNNFILEDVVDEIMSIRKLSGTEI